MPDPYVYVASGAPKQVRHPPVHEDAKQEEKLAKEDLRGALRGMRDSLSGLKYGRSILIP